MRHPTAEASPNAGRTLVRNILRLAAVAYPLGLGITAYLGLERSWPWYESVASGLGVFWATPMVWLAWHGFAVASLRGAPRGAATP